ncbi:MAG TPA: hypothetical protein VFW65_35240 [Pseudonocardiaceae bacterium]|nr:hypothetical protein [Pseudonocardiaceae bacterium]
MNRHRDRRALPAEQDPELLLAAAHELGHAIVDLAHQVPVLGVEVNRRTHGGLTRTGFDPTTATPDQWRGALIGDLAGFEAELLWCHRHGGHADPASAVTDYANFTRHARRVGLTRGVARTRARSVLIAHWPRLERLALRLARHGHLDPAEC